MAKRPYLGRRFNTVNVREVHALVLLYQHCESEELRRRVEVLVPDLTDLRTATVVEFPVARRWRLTARSHGSVVAQKDIVAYRRDLPTHALAYAAELPFIEDPMVSWEEL